MTQLCASAAGPGNASGGETLIEESDYPLSGRPNKR